MRNCSKLCSSILTFVWHYPVLQNVNLLLEGTFSSRKMKIRKWPTVRNMCFQKLWTYIIFQNKTLLVTFYRHNKTFWYQFCNFKHFLKAENSEDSSASWCEEFCISFPVTQYETGLLLELVCHVTQYDWVTVGTTDLKTWKWRAAPKNLRQSGRHIGPVKKPS